MIPGLLEEIVTKKPAEKPLQIRDGQTQVPDSVNENSDPVSPEVSYVNLQLFFN